MFQRCPYSNEHLNIMSPTLIVRQSASTNSSSGSTLNLLPLPTLKTSMLSSTIVKNSRGSKDLEISGVNTISADTFNVTGSDTSGASVSTGLNFNNILNVTDLNRLYSIEDAQSYFDTITEKIEIQNRRDAMANKIVRPAKKTMKVPAAASSASAQIGVAAPPQTSWYERPAIKAPESIDAATAAAIVSSGTSVNATQRSTQLQKEIDSAAYALVKGTGLEGVDLYRCGFENCTGTGSDPICFNVHLLKHTNMENQDRGFKCYHCSLYSKNIIGLKYHIKVSTYTTSI